MYKKGDIVVIIGDSSREIDSDLIGTISTIENMSGVVSNSVGIKIEDRFLRFVSFNEIRHANDIEKAKYLLEQIGV